MRAEAEKVASGRKCADRSGGYSALVTGTLHIQGIADYHALEADLLPEQPLEDLARIGGSHTRIKGWHADVRRHHRNNSAIRNRLEGNEFPALKCSHRNVKTRKTEMRVHRSIPVSREVFRAGCHALTLQTLHPRHRVTGNQIGVRPERTGADDRIVRVRVDIDIRGSSQIDAKLAQ